jgi:hypothetical protein
MPIRASRVIATAGLAALAALVAVVGPVAAQQREYRFEVINVADAAIEYFYFSACDANNWRSDRLGRREVIEPGARRRFNMYDGIADCCRDLRAKLATGAARQKRGVDVCRETQWVVQ